MNIRLEPTSRWNHGWTLPAVVATVWAALLMVAQVLQAVTGQELILCWFRRATGIACPACGGTRMAQSLASGDLPGAIAFNPLLFALVASLVAWAALRLVWGRRLVVELHPRWRRVGWSLVAVALVANWLYLIAAGR